VLRTAQRLRNAEVAKPRDDRRSFVIESYATGGVTVTYFDDEAAFRRVEGQRLGPDDDRDWLLCYDRWRDQR
jgi:hypothetical protein